MDIDKGLIRHWANLFESGEAKDGGLEETQRKKRDVFTLDIHYVDENGDWEPVDETKYAKTYRTFDGALGDAKRAYREYSRYGEKPVEVTVFGGEYETPDGDIFGEPVELGVVNAETVGKL